VRDRFDRVAIVALATVVAVAPLRVVPTVEADAAVLAARQFVQLHVEATLASMEVALTCCKQTTNGHSAAGLEQGARVSPHGAWLVTKL
jgi:hypothetical protein